MIRAVSGAEKRLQAGAKRSFAQTRLPKRLASVAEVAPILRGLTTHGGKPLIFEFRTSAAVRTYVGGKELARYGRQGTATPDHVIRTKAKPLIVPAPEAARLDRFRDAAQEAVRDYVSDYHAFFKRNNAKSKVKKTELDPMPRMIAVPGLGVFGLGNSVKAAGIAADLFETNMEVITNAERVGRYSVIPEPDIFEIEYWSLEQAKLGKAAEKPLQRKVAVVTGGGSGIGAATARAMAGEGAAVAVLDRDAKAAVSVASAIGGLGLTCDVTDAASVKAAFDRVARDFRRRRCRRVERRGGLAGSYRRGRRQGLA